VSDDEREYARTLEAREVEVTASGYRGKLRLPDEYRGDTGVVVRTRARTQDWKSGAPDDGVLWRTNYEPDDELVQNDDLDDDEVRLKKYGEEPELYEVDVPKLEVVVASDDGGATFRGASSDLPIGAPVMLAKFAEHLPLDTFDEGDVVARMTPSDPQDYVLTSEVEDVLDEDDERLGMLGGRTDA
jgi:hypothetical protein